MSTSMPERIPGGFFCPITHEIMHDPVVASDGAQQEPQLPNSAAS